MSKHAVKQRTTCTAVTIRERVDGLELSMRDRCVSKHRDVDALAELNEISHQRWHPVMVGRHKRRRMRRDPPTSNPHLLVTEFPGEVWRALTEEGMLHCDDCFFIYSVCEF